MGVNRTIRGKKEGDEEECIQDQYDDNEANDQFEEIPGEESSSSSSSSVVSAESNSSVVDIYTENFRSYSENLYQKLKIKRRIPSSPLTILASSCIGQRRARRIANNRHLIEIGGGDLDADLEEPSCSVFSRILKNEAEYQVWETFLNSSEDEQLALINGSKQYQMEHIKTKSNRNLTEKEAFQLLTPSQRFVVKKNRTLGFLTRMDKEIVCFFLDTPLGTYVPPCFTSFERLIVHAIASYYQLQSHSFNDTETNERVTQVNNARGSFRVPTTSLCNYLSHMSGNEKSVSDNAVLLMNFQSSF